MPHKEASQGLYLDGESETDFRAVMAFQPSVVYSTSVLYITVLDAQELICKTHIR